METEHIILATSSTSYYFLSVILNVVERQNELTYNVDIYHSLMNNNLRNQQPIIVENLTYNVCFICHLCFRNQNRTTKVLT